jgi:hypothetical protein
MSDKAIEMVPIATSPEPQSLPLPTQRPSRLTLVAAAQVLPAATARALGLTEGKHRLGLFLLVCGLFGVIVPVEIAADSEMFVSRKIMGVPPHFALTAFVVALAMLFDLRYYQRVLQRPTVVLALVCIAILLGEGILRYGMRSYLVRSDLYIMRWFFVGFILMRLATAAGMLRPYLVFAAIVILIVAARIDSTNSLAGQIDTATKRIASSNLWPVINCGTVMIGLLLSVTWPRSWRYAAFGAAAFALLAFIGSIRTSTRSLFAAQALCLVLVLLALSRDPRMRGRGRGIQRAATAIAVLGAVFLIYQVVLGNVLGGYSQLAGRFAESAQETSSGTGRGRIAEATMMVEEMTPDEWILGKGLGGMFYSRLGYWANSPHIAVLAWLLKGGIPLLLIVLATVYIAPSLAFFRQLSRPRKTSPLPPPILIVGPILVSWCALTVVSGGIDMGSFLGLGGLTYLWIQLTDDDKVLEWHRRSAGYLPYAIRPAEGVREVVGAA